MLMPQFMTGATTQKNCPACHQQVFSHALNAYCNVPSQIYLRSYCDLRNGTGIAKNCLSQDYIDRHIIVPALCRGQKLRVWAYRKGRITFGREGQSMSCWRGSTLLADDVNIERSLYSWWNRKKLSVVTASSFWGLKNENTGACLSKRLFQKSRLKQLSIFKIFLR